MDASWSDVCYFLVVPEKQWNYLTLPFPLCLGNGKNYSRTTFIPQMETTCWGCQNSLVSPISGLLCEKEIYFYLILRHSILRGFVTAIFSIYLPDTKIKRNSLALYILSWIKVKNTISSEKMWVAQWFIQVYISVNRWKGK